MQPGTEGAIPADSLSPFVGEVASDTPTLTRVGAYRVLRVLGEGGMGVVYLAEQDESVRRQVAIKVLRAGGNTSEVVARFRSEQQTLAMMDHPNITHVYDAGTTDSGLAYIVMEYVVGDTITAYASAHRLTVRERIRLFVQVCRAVQHAHQKGVIHRDIKPSNVVVTEADGEPLCKVIDFGIAKALAPTPGSARLTATGIALGTPAYMSPEQFLSDGADVDTRADIYALGAMLYELLAGVLPFDPAKYSGWAALLAKRVSSDPPRPSAQYATLPSDRRALVASERRLDAGMLRDLRRAALLHDVGKLAISNRILDKPAPLTSASSSWNSLISSALSARQFSCRVLNSARMAAIFCFCSAVRAKSGFWFSSSSMVA